MQSDEERVNLTSAWTMMMQSDEERVKLTAARSMIMHSVEEKGQTYCCLEYDDAVCSGEGQLTAAWCMLMQSVEEKVNPPLPGV